MQADQGLPRQAKGRADLFGTQGSVGGAIQIRSPGLTEVNVSVASRGF